MFKRSGRKSATKDPKKKQLWGKDFDIVSDGLDEQQVVSFVTDLLKQREESVPASIRSILKTAIVSAERITDAIQKKAQAEAEDEATGIIAQASQKIEEIAGKPDKENKKPPEGVLPEETEAPEEETEDTAQLPVETSGETIGLQAQVQSEATEEPKEEPRDEGPRVPSEAGESSSTGIIESILTEPQPTKGKSDPEKPKTGPMGQDSQSLYTGEVELTITKPVDPKMVSILYNYLQTTPEIKFVRTSGSWERGTTITVALDKPIALISVLSLRIPEAEVIPERPERDGFVSGKKGVRSIKLALKKG